MRVKEALDLVEDDDVDEEGPLDSEPECLVFFAGHRSGAAIGQAVTAWAEILEQSKESARRSSRSNSAARALSRD